MRLCWWMAAEGGSDLRVQHSGAEAHVLWSRLPNSGAGCVCCAQSAQSCLTLWDPWTGAHQAPLSMGFPRQAYWSGLLFPPPGDLPDPGVESWSRLDRKSVG